MYRKVYVEITNICNMNCSFCHGTKRAPRRMSLEEFRLVLEKIKPHTEYVYYHLMGEPLTHPELGLFLETAAEMGFKSIITTNGTLLKQKGQVLIDRKVHKVSISLHSFEGRDIAAHEKYLSEVAEFAKAAQKPGIIVVLRLWNNGCDGGKNAETFEFLKGEIKDQITDVDDALNSFKDVVNTTFKDSVIDAAESSKGTDVGASFGKEKILKLCK